MSSSSQKIAKGFEFFKPFDPSTAYRCDQEHVLYVQPALFPSNAHATEDEEHEIFYCMFTTQRFIICKQNEEGMISQRKQLNYQNIKQFKLKKNKRFKKSNLPSIKIYVIDSNNTDQLQLKTPNYSAKSSDDANEKDRDKDKEKPKVIVSFKESEERDTFYTKMIEIIGYKKRKRSKSHSASASASAAGYKSHSATETEKDGYDNEIDAEFKFDYQIYNTLDVIVERQDIYNEYLSIKDSMEIFRFLDPAIDQAIKVTDLNHDKYVLQLNRDDIKHLKAFYRKQPDNFQIRNNRKQWFINCWCATKLFRNYFPISVSSDVEWFWIQQICRSSIYFMNDTQMNQRCIQVMDILMKYCFGTKYVKPMDTFFHETDYQNLQILYHLMSNYINLSNSRSNIHNIPKLRYKQMILIMIKNNKKCSADYVQYFIDLIQIPILKFNFKESDIYLCIIHYIEHMDIIDIDNDPIVVTLTQILKNDKKINKIWPQNSLYLQEIIALSLNPKNTYDTNYIMMRLKINLMIDVKLLHKTYANQYDGLNALQFAQKKQVSSNIIEFLQNQSEGSEIEAVDVDIEAVPGVVHKKKEEEEEEGGSALLMPQFNDNRDQDQNKSLIFVSPKTKPKQKAKPKLKTKSKIKVQNGNAVTRTTAAAITSSLSPSWGFTSFVGQCFSFTQLSPQPANGTNHMTLNQPKHYDLQRKLQSYISTLEQFKQKTRNLEQKIAKLNTAMNKQNEKIIELKLENKMLKNVFMNKENEKSDGFEYEYDGNQEINQQDWKRWSYLEIIHWICSLKNGRFKKYKNTLKVNLKLRNIKGSHLSRMEKSDLTYFYGIVDFEDVCDLYQEIENLVAVI